MSLYQQFASYGDLNPPTTFDSPLTLSGLSPLNSTSDSVDHLTSLDLSAYGTSTSTSQNFNLNPNSVERILHLPHIYSPVTPPDRSQLARLGTTNLMTNGKVNSITTSVIVANSSITSSTTATMSKSIESSRFPASKPVTSSTVSTIVMQSTEKNNQSSASGNQPNVSCLICGDIPLGKNFGIVTCGSCKIFFRRNINFADKTKSQCRNNNRCVITKANRRNCAACRLRKCINLGMSVKVKQNKHSKGKSGELLDEDVQENVSSHRVHSHSSTSEEEDDGYRDLPSLIPVEEVQTRLESRKTDQQKSSDTLLDEVNSVIIEHIIEEQSAAKDKLDQLASGIEDLASGLSVDSLLEPIEIRHQTNNFPIITDVVSSLVNPIVPVRSEAAGSPSVIVNSSFANQNLPFVSHELLPKISEPDFEEEEKEEIDEDENENEEEEEEVDDDNNQLTNAPHSFESQLSSLSTQKQSHYESSSVNQCAEACVHDNVVFSQDGNSCAIDLTLPECILKSKQERMLYFYQQQQTPYLSCDFQNFCKDEKIVVDGFNKSFTYRQNKLDNSDEYEYKIHDGNSLMRQKRMLERDGKTDMELVKREAKNLGSPIHTQISELCKMTSLIRIKLGIEYSTSNGSFSEYQLNTKEIKEIGNLNTACRMIDLKPNTAANHCTHVYDSLRHGIFYANKTFKVFEEFWLQNKDMRELIRQDETRFDRKRNNLLHMLYHCRGVYNFDESQNAWAVSNGNNQNTFAYIKLTMFNESIKKEMTSKHYQYIQSFPKEWRKDPTVFNLMTFLLIFGAFKEIHSQSKYEKIRFQTLLYLVKRYFDDKYRDSSEALMMLNHMLQLIEDLEPLSSDCLTACTHSLNPRILERIGPNYAACLQLEIQQKKEDEEHRKRRKHSRHSESSDVAREQQSGHCVGEFP